MRSRYPACCIPTPKLPHGIDLLKLKPRDRDKIEAEHERQVDELVAKIERELSRCTASGAGKRRARGLLERLTHFDRRRDTNG